MTETASRSAALERAGASIGEGLKAIAQAINNHAIATLATRDDSFGMTSMVESARSSLRLDK